MSGAQCVCEGGIDEIGVALGVTPISWWDALSVFFCARSPKRPPDRLTKRAGHVTLGHRVTSAGAAAMFAGHEVAMMMATMMMTTGMGTMTTGRALPAASGARSR